MWTLAVKNIFRNRRRTVLSGIAILVAALIICLMLAFETGMIDDMRENVINHVIGDYRVRIKEYSENERVSPLQFYLEDVTQVMKALESVEGVEKAVPLTTIGISIWQGDNSNEAVMIGTDLKKSNFFNDKKSEILEGELPKEGEKKVAITESLAKKLNLKIGDRFTFLTKTASGGSNALGVEVSAIVYLQDSDISDSTVFIPYDVLSKTLRMKDGAIQIQVFSSGNNIEMKEKALLNSISTFKGNFEIKHWSKISSIYFLLKMAEIIYLYIGIIFFLLASTVIINTTMMSVLERKREMATLIALGYSKKWVRRLFLLESGIIAGVFSTLGTLLGVVLVRIFGVIGVDMNALGGGAISGMSLSQWIYPSIDLTSCLLIIVLGITVSVGTCLFPTKKILRLEPAEALHDDI